MRTALIVKGAITVKTVSSVLDVLTAFHVKCVFAVFIVNIAVV